MESRLVDALRIAGLITLSLVAEEDSVVIGSAVYSLMTHDAADGELRAVGLAPLAVLPEFHGSGIGSALARRGIELCRDAGFGIMAVYGSTVYYSRFGFRPAEELNIESGDEGIEPEHFQALMLKGEAPSGTIRLRYAPQFFMA
jgi:predicted N-acetyltransferase YhbS